MNELINSRFGPSERCHCETVACGGWCSTLSWWCTGRRARSWPACRARIGPRTRCGPMPGGRRCSWAGAPRRGWTGTAGHHRSTRAQLRAVGERQRRRVPVATMRHWIVTVFLQPSAVKDHHHDHQSDPGVSWLHRPTRGCRKSAASWNNASIRKGWFTLRDVSVTSELGLHCAPRSWLACSGCARRLTWITGALGP